MRLSRYPRLIAAVALTGLLALSIGAMAHSSNAGDTPKSIIFVIADGAGIGQHSLSYYNHENYAPVRFEHVGLVATDPSTRNRVTDSAASATAYATGVKTYNGAIGVDDNREPLKTVIDYAFERGMATGLVATSSITHATPASFAAHVARRSSEEEIARQMATSTVDVMLGGGLQFFQSRQNGGRQETDLLDSLASAGNQVISNLDQRVEPGRRIIGLFAQEGMSRAIEGRSPTTTEMALWALDILDDDPDGFFLMVEESQVDWESHDNETEATLAEMASLNDLLNALVDYQAQHPEVLLLMTADHETGGLGVVNSRGGLTGGWIHGNHTGNFVPIFATGPGGELFDALIDNTFIGQALIRFVTSR